MSFQQDLMINYYNMGSCKTDYLSGLNKRLDPMNSLFSGINPMMAMALNGTFDPIALFTYKLQQNAGKTASGNSSSNTNNYSKNYSSSSNANLGEDFYRELENVANRIGCSSSDLLALMNAESGLNPAAVNSNGGATGLIQFMPNTAKGLGTSTAELAKMSAVEQLAYVEKYLLRAKASAGIQGNLSAGDLATLTFLPARAGREVLTTSNEIYYAHNKGLDLNKDGKITKAELGERLERFA